MNARTIIEAETPKQFLRRHGLRRSGSFDVGDRVRCIDQCSELEHLIGTVEMVLTSSGPYVQYHVRFPQYNGTYPMLAHEIEPYDGPWPLEAPDEIEEEESAKQFIKRHSISRGPYKFKVGDIVKCSLGDWCEVGGMVGVVEMVTDEGIPGHPVVSYQVDFPEYCGAVLSEDELEHYDGPLPVPEPFD